MPLKGIDHGGKVQQGTAQPIQLIDDYLVYQAPFYILHHFGELGPVCIFPAEAPVDIYLHVPGTFQLAEFYLGLYG